MKVLNSTTNNSSLEYIDKKQFKQWCFPFWNSVTNRVVRKTPAATAMAGAKTNNNQLKAACRRGHAAAKLLPPSCCRRRQAAHHCRTAAAATVLPLPPIWTKYV
jgi:hypothetical protein